MIKDNTYGWAMWLLGMIAGLLLAYILWGIFQFTEKVEAKPQWCEVPIQWYALSK